MAPTRQRTFLSKGGSLHESKRLRSGAALPDSRVSRGRGIHCRNVLAITCTRGRSQDAPLRSASANTGVLSTVPEEGVHGLSGRDGVSSEIQTHVQRREVTLAAHTGFGSGCTSTPQIFLDLGRPDQVQLVFQRRVGKRTPSEVAMVS